MSGRFEQKTHETLLKLLKVKSLDSISATDITSDLELTKQAFSLPLNAASILTELS